MTILNSSYFTECRFIIRHITQTQTETLTEANFTHNNARFHLSQSIILRKNVDILVVVP